MNETAMRKTMKEHFRAAYPEGRWTRIENSVEIGTPDINFMALSLREAWCEAKYMDAEDLPKRASTPVKLGLKPEQRIWLENNRRAGGVSLVAARIGKEWFVFDCYFREIQDGVTLASLRVLAAAYWTGSFDITHLVRKVL